MSGDVSVLFVHGIYADDLNYSKGTQKRIISAIPKEVRPHVKFKSVWWADIVRGRSQQYLQQAHTATGISTKGLRQFAVEGLGDAAAYQKTRDIDNSAYYQIQERVSQALRDADAIEDPDRPLIIIAHSLGCHIASSYIWDINNLKQTPIEDIPITEDPRTKDFASELQNGSKFRRLDTLAGFITMGSNQPLFTFTFGPDKVYPITRHPRQNEADHTKKRIPAFPGTSLPIELARNAKWLNFFSVNDILGYPLKPLNVAYFQEERLTDIAVCSEGWSHFGVPHWKAIAAHTGYWHNRTVVAKAAELLTTTCNARSNSQCL